MDEILRKARKLASMAADLSSPNEAAIAQKRLAEFLSEYDISQADLKEEDRDGFCQCTIQIIRTFDFNWIDSLSLCMQHCFDLKGVVHIPYGCRVPNSISLFGRIVDVKTAEYYFHLIAGQLVDAMKVSSAIHGHRRVTASFAQSYSLGVYSTIYGVFSKTKQQVTDSGKDIVLAKHAGIGDFMKQNLKNYNPEDDLFKSKSHGVDRDALLSGASDAESFSLIKPLEGAECDTLALAAEK